MPDSNRQINFDFTATESVSTAIDRISASLERAAALSGQLQGSLTGLGGVNFANLPRNGSAYPRTNSSGGAAGTVTRTPGATTSLAGAAAAAAGPQKITAAYAQAMRQMNSYSRSQMTLASVQQKVNTQFGVTTAAVTKTTAALKQQQTLLSRMSQKGGSFLFGIIEYKALQAATDALGAFFDEVNRSVDAAAKMARFKQSFTNLLGPQAGAQAFGDVKQFAFGTPFSLDESIALAQRFVAVGFQWQQVIPMMTAAGNSVARLGKGNADLDRLVLALTQIQSKGRLMGQEMRQMSEVGVDALSILASSLGKTTAQAQQMVTAGKISSDTFFEAFKKWDAANGDFMKAQSQDYIGIQRNLADVREQMEAAFGVPIMQARAKASKDLLDLWSRPGVQMAAGVMGQGGGVLGSLMGLGDRIANLGTQANLYTAFLFSGAIQKGMDYSKFLQALDDYSKGVTTATTATDHLTVALERQKQAAQDRIDVLTKQNELLQNAVSLEDKLAGLGEDQFNIDKAKRLSLSVYTSQGRSALDSLPGLYEKQASDLRHFAVDQQIAANSATIKILQANIDAGVLNMDPKYRSALNALQGVSGGASGYGSVIPQTARQFLMGNPGALSGYGGAPAAQVPRSSAWYGSQYLLANPQYLSGYGGGRASGGSVSGGGWYTVGEHGPEMLHAGGSGSVTPNDGMVVTHRCPDCNTNWLVEQAGNPRVARAFGKGIGTY